ncbi:mitochondrial calcium uniporter regulator 1-like [Lineus longissimus]|uniref:mitochondrial calcium uniporter regulator 1-like n=1 Tax=Lineus longissimus TaxID=88925 RepID=UPI002B4E5367
MRKLCLVFETRSHDEKMAAPMAVSARMFRNFSTKDVFKTCSISTIPRLKQDILTKRYAEQPSCSMNYDSRSIPEIIPKRGSIHFDTHAAVKVLEANGFIAQKAEAVVSLILEISSAAAENGARTLVTKEQQEIMLQQIMAQIASVKKDMIILEKSEFSALRNETDKVQIEIQKLKESMADELIKLKGNMMLDINLERSRSMEAHNESMSQLKTVDHRILNEVANLETKFERYRNDIFKYAGGTILSCLTIILGFYRLWS